MSYLYKNPKGFEVRAHSHSGGQDWSCPKKYYWKRLQGWQSKEEGAPQMFGKCTEAAIKYFHERNFEPGTGVEEFRKLWWDYKNEDILYTEKSGNWNDFFRCGVELLKLYELQLPDLPISNAVFSVERRVDLAPGDGLYGGLQFMAVLDMLCTAPNNHPALPAMEGPEVRQFVVDIKTSTASYYTDPRLSSLDDQLRDYAWVTGLSTVAFLVLCKNHTEIGTGDWITVLEGPKQGKKYKVFDIKDGKLLVLPKELFDEYQSRKKEIKGKGAKERGTALLTEYFYKGLSFQRHEVTKQKIQFLPAIISQQDADEAKREAIHEAMDIADHNREQYFPKRPGVRFPHNPCTSCECLGLCIGDEGMVKENLVQIGAQF